MTNLAEQMKLRDREMVPRVLVRAMFALMVFSVALTAFAVWTDRPKVGQLTLAPVAETRDVTFVPAGDGFALRGADGAVLAASDEARAGFIAVIGRLLDRERARRGADLAAPVTILKRENGGIGISDPESGFSVELVGYGADNVAAFARVFD